MTVTSRIYVRLPNWVGDVCMALPSLALLRQSGVAVTACARPWARDLLAGIGDIDVLPMRGQLKADIATVRAHRRAQVAAPGRAVGLLMPDSLSSALVSRLAGLPSAGYRDEGRSILLRWPFAKPEPAPHAVLNWYGLTREALSLWKLPCDPATPPARLDLPLTAAHAHDARQAVQQAGIHTKPFVLIAPTAVGLHHGKVKVWPHFDALTRALQAHGVVVAMCPPPAEQDQAKANAPTALCLPALGLGAFAALTRFSTLVVCNDSGVSHISAATGAPQVTLFGVTNPERTGPWTDLAIRLGSSTHWPELDTVLDRVLQSLRASSQGQV